MRRFGGVRAWFGILVSTSALLAGCGGSDDGKKDDLKGSSVCLYHPTIVVRVSHSCGTHVSNLGTDVPQW